MAIKVAVVGAGPLGLMAIKNLKEDGFEVHAFEKRDWVGGLWKQSFDSSISVTANTVFNTSRARANISDYPFPETVGDFPTAKEIWQYMEDYCDHFGLRPLIRFGAEVKTFSRSQGKWKVEFVQKGTSHTDTFDKLVVAPGSFTVPRPPKLKDIEKFEGKVLHSINFPDPAQFKHQNVLLIGFHATAQDLVVELRPHAKKVYLSNKNGLLMLRRHTEDGKPFDYAQTVTVLRMQLFLAWWLPSLWDWVIEKALIGMCKKGFPDQREEWNLSPGPSVSVTPPLIADEVYPHLQSGFAVPVPAVKEILGPKQVALTDGRVLDDIDTIIYTTGYVSAVSCAPNEYDPYPVVDEAPYLYRNMIPLHADPDVRNSLAFLGQGGFAFPGFVQFELQIWAVSQIWQRKQRLPPLSEMQKWHHNNMAWRARIVKNSRTNSRFVPVILPIEEQLPWLDQATGAGVLTHFSSCSWRSWWFWATDRKFYNLCKEGVLSPAIWRLFDMGGRKPWSGARDQIIRDNEIAKTRQQEKLKEMGKFPQNGN